MLQLHCLTFRYENWILQLLLETMPKYKITIKGIAIIFKYFQKILQKL